MALSVIFLSHCATQMPGVKYEAIRLYNEGLNLGAKGEFQEAVNAFEGAVKAVPAFPEAWFNLGIAYEKLRDPDQARNAYAKALEFDPDMFEARVGLAEKYHDSGLQNGRDDELKTALSLYKEVLEKDPTFYPVLYRIGLIESSLNQTESSIKSMEDAWRCNPLHFQSSLWLAKRYSEQKNFPGCLVHYRYAETIEGDNSTVLRGIVKCYAQNNQRALAEKWMEHIRAKFRSETWVLQLESEVRIWPKSK